MLHIIEPTTGLDPVSRRHVWDAINLMKKDKVVVLTTHNMEEADFLGDTIMIMHNGHGGLIAYIVQLIALCNINGYLSLFIL